MKNLCLAVTVCIALASCNYIAGDYEKTDSTAVADSSYFSHLLSTTRDTSIDSSNAYNNLFLDTAAVDAYIKKNNIAANEAREIKGFYNMRNYQFAWFAHDGMTEQGRSLWSAYTYSKSHGQKDTLQDKGFIARMDTIAEMDTLMIAANDTSFNETEVALTCRFISYYKTAGKQSVMYQLPFTFLLPVRKTDPVTMADSVLSYETASTATDSTAPYAALKEQLAVYDSIAKKGGWQPVTGRAGTLRKGISSPLVSAIKKRLQVSGEYSGSDTSARYSDSLDIAIKSYQERNGFKPDGVVTDSLIAVMNVPVEQRIEQILVNMNRMAWMPHQVKDNFVAVNIPEFMLEVHEGDSVPVKMEVVVGKEGTNTMMFAGDLNQVVFNPTWNVPPSIVKEELLPAMQKDPNYLKKQNMEVVRKNDSLPEIRQLPGQGNALGKVKFLFPNSYDIYLHDTEAKGLFAKDKRAFSHGCIRVADAEKLSQYVLRHNNWTRGKVRSAMNSNKEQPVAVNKPLPVVITYFTTWVDEEGQIHFRDDIYQHDKRTAAMMFKDATGTA